MKTHRLRLDASPFAQVKSGTKTFEIRLHDNKRQQLSVGDVIVFWNKEEPTNETMMSVVSLVIHPTFIELFRAVPPELSGWPSGTAPQVAANRMREFYSAGDEARWGAIAIQLAPVFRTR
jgi:ASC-1-like (ASCH) protein